MRTSKLNFPNDQASKIGLLGGTFDPPHYGHLLIASEVLEQCHLDQIWFVPNNVPPHKQRSLISEARHRLNMLALAIENNPRFHLSTVETDRTGRSYTYDTIQLLQSQYENKQFYFIIGADMVHKLDSWKNIHKLVQLVTFIGVNRDGYSLTSAYDKWIQYVEIPLFAVSSTLLRHRFEEQKNTRYYLPEKVRNYIKENRLYGKR